MSVTRKDDSELMDLAAGGSDSKQEEANTEINETSGVDTLVYLLSNENIQADDASNSPGTSMFDDRFVKIQFAEGTPEEQSEHSDDSTQEEFSPELVSFTDKNNKKALARTEENSFSYTAKFFKSVKDAKSADLAMERENRNLISEATNLLFSRNAATNVSYTEQFFKNREDVSSEASAEKEVSSVSDKGPFDPVVELLTKENKSNSSSEIQVIPLTSQRELFNRPLLKHEQRCPTEVPVVPRVVEKSPEKANDFEASTSFDSEETNSANMDDEDSSFSSDLNVSNYQSESLKIPSPFKNTEEFPEGWKGKTPLSRKYLPKNISGRTNENKSSVYDVYFPIPEEHLRENWNINPCINFESLSEKMVAKWESSYDTYLPDNWIINPLMDFVGFSEYIQDESLFVNECYSSFASNPLKKTRLEDEVEHLSMTS